MLASEAKSEKIDPSFHNTVLKFENQEIILPIGGGIEEDQIHLWTGSEANWDLFLSGDYFLVEVADASKWLSENSGAAASGRRRGSATADVGGRAEDDRRRRNSSPFATNVQILVGMPVYQRLGLSKLADIGTVRQLESVFRPSPTTAGKLRTTATKKIPENEVPENRDGCAVLQLNDDFYLTDYELHELRDVPDAIDAKIDALASKFEEGFKDNLEYENLSSRVRGWFFNTLGIPKSLVLSMLVFRLIFGYFFHKSDLFMDDPLKNSILKFGDYFSNMATSWGIWHRTAWGDSYCDRSYDKGGIFSASWLLRFFNFAGRKCVRLLN